MDQTLAPRASLPPGNEIDNELRRRAGEHPDVDLYLRHREETRARLQRLLPVVATPEEQEKAIAAEAWATQALGFADPEKRQANAVRLVDGLCGTTPAASAYAAEVAVAVDAAEEWVQSVTGSEVDQVLVEQMHTASMLLRAGDRIRTPADVMIRMAADHLGGISH